MIASQGLIRHQKSKRNVLAPAHPPAESSLVAAAKGSFVENRPATIGTNAQWFGDRLQKPRSKSSRASGWGLGERPQAKPRRCQGRPCGQQSALTAAKSGDDKKMTRSKAQSGAGGLRKTLQHSPVACAGSWRNEACRRRIGRKVTGICHEGLHQFETRLAKGWIWAAAFVTRLCLRGLDIGDIGLLRSLVKSGLGRPLFLGWGRLRRLKRKRGQPPSTPEGFKGMARMPNTRMNEAQNPMSLKERGDKSPNCPRLS